MESLSTANQRLAAPSRMQLLQSLTTDFARPQVKATTRGEDVLQRQDEKLLHGDVGVVGCVQPPHLWAATIATERHLCHYCVGP